MWHSTVAQTTGVALHPPSAAEITCKTTSEKCKSAFKLIKCPLDGRCLVKLQNPNAKPGCSLLKTGEIQQQQLLRLQEIKSRSGGGYFKLEIRLAGTNKTRVKAKLFLLTFLFSHPWGATKRAERLCHPSLPWFDVRVAAESRICCAELSANLARLSPKRFTIFRP